MVFLVLGHAQSNRADGMPRPCYVPRQRKAPAKGGGVPRLTDLQFGGAAAGSSYRLAGTAAELVRGHVDLGGQLAVAEHLDQDVLTNQAFCDQFVDTDDAAVRERFVDVTDVDDGVLGAEPIAGSP